MTMTAEERAALEPIRPALMGTGRELLHCHGGRWQRRVGRFNLVDDTGRLVDHHINLQANGWQSGFWHSVTAKNNWGNTCLRP